MLLNCEGAKALKYASCGDGALQGYESGSLSAVQAERISDCAYQSKHSG